MKFLIYLSVFILDLKTSPTVTVIQAVSKRNVALLFNVNKRVSLRAIAC